MFFLILLFRMTALFLTGFMVGGTIMGVFPVKEIFTLIVPLVMWILSKCFEKIFGFSPPEFLDTTLKKTVVYVAVFAVGFLCVL